MKLYSLFFFIGFYFITNNCSAEEKFPPEGKTIPEMIDLQNEIINKVKLLDADKWEDRQKAKKELLALIEKDKYVFRYFLKITYKNRSPEIKLSSKELMKEYFKQNIHDPDRKKGFIGISMTIGGRIIWKKVNYSPILIANVIADFPGEKAGLKANDKIIQVDKNICSPNFGVDGFTAYIASKKPGDKVTLRLISGNKEATKELILGERPKDQPSSIPSKGFKRLFEEWYKLKIQEISK